MSDVDHVALTAVGVDQPGIVAELSAVLMELGCNLEDSSMSILRGNFAVLLIAALPDGLAAPAVEEALAPVAAALDLVVTVRPLAPDGSRSHAAATGAADDTHDGQTFAFSVHGADRPGIVHHVTRALALAGGNVVDLSTRLVGTDADPVYVLTITVGFPDGVDGQAAAEEVQRSAEAFGVQCHAHPVDVDVL
ncbi:MAG: glycine cleavage system protein R [Acidimicrobiales bacterium]